MRLLALSGLVALLFSCAWGKSGPPASLLTAGTSRAKWVSLYRRLPLRFEANQGQTDRQVKYLARGLGYTLFLTRDEAVLGLRGRQSSVVRGQLPGVPDHVLRMKLLGANAAVQVKGVEELPGKSNYFLGNDPKQWRTEVRNYAQVKYEDVYPGTDLVYYGDQQQLEYDFVLRPGADPQAIRLQVGEGSGLAGEARGRPYLDANGDLVMGTANGEVRFHKPVVYQPRDARQGVGNGKFEIQNSELLDGRYVLTAGQQVQFEVSGYDRSKPLVIDPVLSYATYLGGTGGDVAYGITVDSSGDAYITGGTYSTNFPTLGPYQSANKGNGDAFVAKIDATGTKLIYSTYVGGTGSDTATAIAISAGDAFITGATTSSDFPTTTNVFQPSYGGNTDAFVTQLGSAGNTLVYSSYLGGTGSDSGQGIAVDSSGNAYVTGTTQSVDFPTVNPLQGTNGGASDVFVAKVNFSGSALVYSTYLGGMEADVGQAIAVDKSGNAFITGYTLSSNFPTQNPLQGSSAGQADAFVAEIDAAGSALTFSTYFGGSGDDRAFGIALDSSGNVYITGATQSTDFPTTSGAFQTSNGGQGDAFVSKFNSSGSALVYSTFLGGGGVDQGNGIAVDASGDAFITGFTQSSNFPSLNAIQKVLQVVGGGSCGPSPCADAFITELNPTGSGVIYSTYLGGSGADQGNAIALDASGDAFITGFTQSSNFPVVAQAYQGDLSGTAGNAFLAKLDPSDKPGIAIVPQKVAFGNQTVTVRSAVESVSIIDVGTQPLQITQITSSNTDFAESDNCVGTVPAGGGSCAINLTFTPAATGLKTTTITITDNAAGSPHTFTANGTGVTAATAVTLSPTSLTFGNQTVGTTSAPQTVTITNTGTATLNITQISTAGDYSQTNTCGSTLNILNVGASCSVSVIFSPTASGARNGTLSIADNASGSPQTAALSGTGLAEFSLSSTATSTTTVIGSSTATFMVSASAPSTFTGSITITCSGTNVTCTSSPTSIFAGQSATITLSGLTASTANPFNFTVNGTSGAQTATLPYTILFEDYALSATPVLDTIVAGEPAPYSVIVTPLNGFNKEIQFSCANLPAGASCSFSSTTITPSGSSPTTVKLTVITTKTAFISGRRLWPGGGGSLPLFLWPLCMGVLGILFWLRRRLGALPAGIGARLAFSPKLIILSLILALGALLGACRPVAVVTGTPTGNYTITITGTLLSNTAVQRSTSTNLAVTAPPA